MSFSPLFASVSVSPELFGNIFATFAFILGAIVGSFLNVCIYRMPLGLRVDDPKRSFCPSCKKQIPWYQNLPILSWILLMGKCANCRTSISPRYLLVEALTGALFLGVWLRFQSTWIVVFPLFIFVSLMIVATFIDFEHFMIPDEITKGGVVAGAVLSLAIPLLHGADNPVMGLAWSLLGAAVGFGSLYIVVKLGKLAFGTKSVKFSEPQELSWTGIGEPPEKDADLKIGPDKYVWSEFFVEKDQITLDCEHLKIDGQEWQDTPVTMTIEEAHVGKQKIALDQVSTMSGKVRSLVFNREAMGFGDVKFIAAIGAFLGWKGVFFTIFAGSVTGSIVGLILLVLNRREWSIKVPFGPYLSLGALIWVFYGPEFVEWYFGLVRLPG